MTLKPHTTQSNDRPRWLIAYLLFTALVTGALVMVIEVLGSRVIGPFFGVSLFVWTSLIAVTLIALAAGYAVGGWFADRHDACGPLYTIIILAGIWVLFVPLLKGAVLKVCVPLGLRGGSFASTLLLFGPPLFLLGCVSPYLARIATRELSSLGRTVGGLYALSTLGSVAGTVATGFVLIAYIGVDRIFQLVGTLLIGLGAAYFLMARHRLVTLALLALPLPFALDTGDAAPLSKLMENGTQVTLIEAQDSFYGNIKAVEYSYGSRRTREMIIDGLIQGGVDPRNGLSVYDYAYHLEALPLALHPQGTRSLVIGLGAGIIPRRYEARGITTDVVDIDPAVVDFARRHFGFQLRGEIFVDDARYFLLRGQQKYDYIILDVFNGDTTPGYLLSREAIALIQRRLQPDGVVGMNLVARLVGDTYVMASIVKTLGTAFDQVEIYPTFTPTPDSGAGNIIVIAYDGPQREPDSGILRGLHIHPMAREAVLGTLGKRVPPPQDARAVVLTDDYNPIGFYDAELREWVRRDILETTDWDILIASD